MEKRLDQIIEALQLVFKDWHSAFPQLKAVLPARLESAPDDFIIALYTSGEPIPLKVLPLADGTSIPIMVFSYSHPSGMNFPEEPDVLLGGHSGNTIEVTETPEEYRERVNLLNRSLPELSEKIGNRRIITMITANDNPPASIIVYVHHIGILPFLDEPIPKTFTTSDGVTIPIVLKEDRFELL